MVKSKEKLAMVPNKFQILAIGFASAMIAACGGGGSMNSSTNPNPPPQSANMQVMVSDASSEDFATIGVKILSIALVPQGGGANVTVYTAPTMVPTVNLAELDQIAEILGNVTVPAGSYTSAVLTVSANPGDVSLVVAANPEAGFAGTAGETIPMGQIQIQHAQGTAPNLTVPVDVKFVSPLVVTANTNNALALEFDLGHPAFIIGHVPPASGTVLWAVNFNGPVHHRPLHDLSRLVLRHMYGDVTAISSYNSAANAGITITKEFPTWPTVSPETPVTTSTSLLILADSTNGTFIYDLDAKTTTVIKDFSAEGSVVGKNVRIAARYQEDGTLVATRIWASSQFNNVWLSPEGHVLHVNNSTNVVTVEDESGQPRDVVVDANTQFFFRQPWNALADATPIATGTTFLADNDLVRGFKVHVSVADFTATPWIAQTIDIETAVYDGKISAPTMSGFTDTRVFRTATDDYSVTLDYLDSSVANGDDPMSGDPITGFKYWNFAYPTIVTSGISAVTDFIAATNDSVDFGGTVGAVPSRGASFSVWNATSSSWAVSATILTPSLLPLGSVVTGLTMPMGSTTGTFTMTVLGGANAATIEVSSASGSATLVYQVDRTNGVLTISPIDITTSSGLTDLTNGLAAGAPVAVYGIPQSNGTLQAYVLTYFTGMMPAAPAEED
jgi:Domain of unknown function (DUF4382)/Domain of unknown function (DUF5666)